MTSFGRTKVKKTSKSIQVYRIRKSPFSKGLQGYTRVSLSVKKIPDNEDVSKWNPEFPWKFEGEGIRYWVGNINERMDTKILKDILLAGSYNRIISVNEEYGCCLSGYMLDGEEYQQLL